MSQIDEKKLYDTKIAINEIVQNAALFGHRANSVQPFTAKDLAEHIDNLIVMRIKQALSTQENDNAHP